MYIIADYIQTGDIIIDATCGNGQDTVRLAELDPTRLFAFDIQEEAVRATRERLEESGYGEALAEGRIHVMRLGHEHMAEYFRTLADDPGTLPRAKAFAGVIVFNLGFLPGGDKGITTKAETTLEAVRQSMDLLAQDGLICITMYSGHEEGKREKAELLKFAEALDSHVWHVSYIQMLNQKKDPPEILLITRKSETRSDHKPDSKSEPDAQSEADPRS